uniref:Putative secreted protein n=1 Tax=Anopheles darlingi TaxID=43151 RepID=A0A2M4DM44_ANODA
MVAVVAAAAAAAAATAAIVGNRTVEPQDGQRNGTDDPDGPVGPIAEHGLRQHGQQRRRGAHTVCEWTADGCEAPGAVLAVQSLRRLRRIAAEGYEQKWQNGIAGWIRYLQHTGRSGSSEAGPTARCTLRSRYAPNNTLGIRQE